NFKVQAVGHPLGRDVVEISAAELEDAPAYLGPAAVTRSRVLGVPVRPVDSELPCPGWDRQQPGGDKREKNFPFHGGPPFLHVSTILTTETLVLAHCNVHSSMRGIAGGRCRELTEGRGRPYFRRLAAKMRFRKRKLLGVTSTSSSSLMNSRACSRFMIRGGTRCTVSSEPEARMLVSFFSRTMLTSKSLSRACSPTTIPS